ncbi:kirola-like [Momordica charantia]|uniref:Kirola-like n=1 Tax=Momordica charantia TaxID=3673 RepID=A0A6J1C8L4_MOMCH|nr:kirola-like [Momordica charantia]
MKTAVSNSLGDKSLKFSEICDAAIAEEIRRKRSGKEYTSLQGSALAVEKGKEKVASDDRRMGELMKSRQQTVASEKMNPVGTEVNNGVSILAVDLNTVVKSTVGSGKACVVKELIEAIDEEKNLITFKVIDGDISEHYKSFKFTMQCIPKKKGSVVHWTLEYEKQHDKIPESHESLLEFCVDVSKDLDAHLMKMENLGKPSMEKEIIEAVDEEKNSITFKVMAEGDLLEEYKSFKFIFQFIPKVNGSVVH